MQNSITPKQQAVLEAIQAFHARHGRAPSYKELQTRLGYNSTASIWRFVQSLKKKGLILEESRQWHSLQATTAHKDPLLAASSMLEVVLIGNIQSDKPPTLFAQTTTFTLPASLVNHTAGCYGLILEDSSYTDLHLLPYDLVIVEPRIDIAPGELVIASNHETIIGHLFDEGELLQFRSSPYSSKTFHDSLMRVEADTIHIWGVVIATIRSLSFLDQLRPHKRQND